MELRLGAGLLVSLGALALGACTTDTGGRFGTGDTGTGPGDGGVRDAQSDATPFFPDGRINVTDPDGGELLGDASCGMMRSPANRQPLNLLILLDRSGSMSECASGSSSSSGGCSSGDSKWQAVVAAVRRMVTSLDDGSQVGLQFFPASSNPGSTDGYINPVVPIAPLSMNRARILSALSATGPNGNTPMACAVPPSLGVLNAPDVYRGPRSLLLVTDGVATEECTGVMCNPFDLAAFIACEMNAAAQAQGVILASVSAGQRAGVRTYAIGMGAADSRFLSAVALNGGTARSASCLPTGCHYSVSSSSFDTDINAALDEIRGRAASCQFAITIDPATADLNQVNVNYFPGGGMAPRIIRHDATRMDGWDYSDDNRSIILYGPTCDDVRANTRSGSQVEILYGCPTIG